jgi:hypothetical protein
MGRTTSQLERDVGVEYVAAYQENGIAVGGGGCPPLFHSLLEPHPVHAQSWISGVSSPCCRV